MTWRVGEDEEFGKPLLRWDDGPIVAQVLGEDEDEVAASYAELVAAVERSKAPVERVELNRLAGRLVNVVEYVERAAAVRLLEDGHDPAGLRIMAHDASATRNRVIDIARSLPEGPLEAFGRLHPLFDDQLDGPTCGYGAAEGRPYSCPVRDAALHWDAWEMLGTRLRRPPHAVRPDDQRRNG